ncbi:MAG: Thymidylate kinase [Segetibacter sp.]|nr:Thymidylate kinase [Segetibacter sp.]
MPLHLKIIQTKHQMKKNLFIALEGIDGSGKSTQVKLLAQKLKDNGYKVHSTFEPTDNFIGSIIRNILTGKARADNRAIAGLFVADRLDHLLNEENGLVKKLEDGYTVITDRYYFSSYAYHGTHMDMDWVIQANAMSAEILRPDVNIFIDVPPEVSMKRICENREVTELYETLENLKNVREKFMEAFEKLRDKETIYITNGDRSFEEIAGDIWTKVESMLPVDTEQV